MPKRASCIQRMCSAFTFHNLCVGMWQLEVGLPHTTPTSHPHHTHATPTPHPHHTHTTPSVYLYQFPTSSMVHCVSQLPTHCHITSQACCRTMSGPEHRLSAVRTQVHPVYTCVGNRGKHTHTIYVVHGTVQHALASSTGVRA